MYLSRIVLARKATGNLLIDNIRAIAREKPRVSPLPLYEEIVKRGVLHEDSHQHTVVEQLDKFHRDIEFQRGARQAQVVDTTPKKKSGGFGGLFDIFKPSDKAVKQADLVYALDVKEQDQIEQNKLSDPGIVGMYLHGDVGCGKTLLMDLTYECLKHNGAVRGVRRLHFNKFMLDCHRRMHKIKQKIAQNTSGRYQPFDVIPPLADELMQDGWVICFDEFQVTDIADAMIIRRLFFELWRRGMVLICTGNRKPDDLYKNGLQYKNFEPFIPLLRQHTNRVFLNSGIDYRKKDIADHGDTYVLESDENAEQKFEQFLQQITGLAHFTDMSPKTIQVFGRNFVVPRAHKRVALFTFSELCDQPLGAQDYIEIADHFDLVFIKHLPVIDMQNRRAEARRFITLIDNLYDMRTGVVFLAEARPENLFTVENKVRTEWTAEERLFMDDLKIAGTEAAEALSIISGEDEAFALARLISRLSEMKTQEYWNDVKRKIHDHEIQDAKPAK